MITTRYVSLKQPPNQVELDKVVKDYHQQLDIMREQHNLLFAPLYRPFNFKEDTKGD